MFKEMYQIQVRVVDDEIVISQLHQGCQAEDEIHVHPGQIKLLCQWLAEAEAEIGGNDLSA